ncbi:Polyprenyl synthetase [compost metagenome]
MLFLALQSLYDRLPQVTAGPAVEVLVRAGLEMTHGQHVDLLGQAMPLPTFEAYAKAIERKSGASFGAYAQLVAIANGSPGLECQRFRDFGRLLGMMFQMMNDTHELWSATLCPDFVNARLSLPFVLALEQLAGRQREELDDLLAGPKDLERQARLVAFLEGAGLRAYITMRIELIRRRVREAARDLCLDAEPYLASLLETPAFPDRPIAV